MPEFQLQEVIDGLRARLQAELESQLGNITERHHHAVAEARRLAQAEVEADWAARLDSTNNEWHARLDAEVAAARAEAERRLVAEATRARLEAEQSAAEAAARLRAEFESELDAERRRAGELEAERQREREALHELAQARQAADEDCRRAIEERQRGEEDRQRAEEERRSADAERQRAQEERQSAEDARHRAEEDTRRSEAERLRAEEQRQQAEQALADAQRALDAERARVDETLAASAQNAAAGANAQRLREALEAMSAASSLSDVLTRTAAAAAGEAPRAAAFVANGSQLEEWAAGQPPLAAGPVSSQGSAAGILAAVLVSGEVRAAGTGDMRAPDFATLPEGRPAVAVPLLVGGQAVGVLYADGGPDGDGETAWVETVQIIGRHASACLACLTAMRTVEAMRLVSPAGASVPAPLATGDDEGARRHARLLVSEIKLYNETALRLGREHRDIRRRLAPEIDRARRIYGERMGSSASRDALFDKELVHTLADGDESLLG